MAGRDWKLTVRAGARVEHERHASLDDALFAARAHVNALRPGASRGPAQAFLREIAPGEQVPARLELRGPGRARGGVDLRGDGTVVAWTGRLARRLVEAEPQEDPLAALGRVLTPR